MPGYIDKLKNFHSEREYPGKPCAMFLRSITAPLTTVRGIGPALIPKLARLGIRDAAVRIVQVPGVSEETVISAPLIQVLLPDKNCMLPAPNQLLF